MMDAYYRNGELFLNKLGLKKDDLDEDVIKNNYIKPAREFLGYSNVGENAKENEVIKLLRRYFEISGKTTSILKSFQTSKNGKCSYCGDEGKVIENKSFIFPFERKVDSIVNENNRLAFCQKCAFTFYSAMAYLYKKRVEDKNLLFFFDSYDSQTLDSVTSEMKKITGSKPIHGNKIIANQNCSSIRYNGRYYFSTNASSYTVKSGKVYGIECIGKTIAFL
jgi:hypothetical protein